MLRLLKWLNREAPRVILIHWNHWKDWGLLQRRQVYQAFYLQQALKAIQISSTVRLCLHDEKSKSKLVGLWRTLRFREISKIWTHQIKETQACRWNSTYTMAACSRQCKAVKSALKQVPKSNKEVTLKHRERNCLPKSFTTFKRRLDGGTWRASPCTITQMATSMVSSRSGRRVAQMTAMVALKKRIDRWISLESFKTAQLASNDNLVTNQFHSAKL